MNCPKCNATMNTVTIDNIEVDQCNECQGIWFDALEKEKLKAIKGSEVLDTGNPVVGEKFNKIDDVDCPRCKTKMIRMVDLEQHHIWFESCTVCGGSFFDAGEFTDYKNKTIMDFFKDLKAPARD